MQAEVARLVRDDVQLVPDGQTSAQSNDTGDAFDIEVKELTGRILKVTINADDDVRALKARIQEKTGTEPDRQCLCVVLPGQASGAVPLEDETLQLGECGVCRGAQLNLTAQDPQQAAARRAEREQKRAAAAAARQAKLVRLKRLKSLAFRAAGCLAVSAAIFLLVASKTTCWFAPSIAAYPRAYQLSGCAGANACGAFEQTEAMCDCAPAFQKQDGDREVLYRRVADGSDEVFWAVGPSSALDECGGIAVSGGLAVNSSGEWPILSGDGALAFGTDAHVSVFGAEMQNLLPTQDVTLEMCECSNGRLGLDCCRLYLTVDRCCKQGPSGTQAEPTGRRPSQQSRTMGTRRGAGRFNPGAKETARPSAG